jgi:hypothetical protein
MLEDILVPLGVFAMIAYIAKVISNARIRRRALESPFTPMQRTPSSIRAGLPRVPSQHWSGASSSLRSVWVFLVDLFAIRFESPLAYGILVLSTGTALLGYCLTETGRERARRVRAHGPSWSTTERSSSEDIPDPEL